MSFSDAKRTSTAVKSKRASVAPSGPKAPTTLDPTCIIADKAILSGTRHITIGTNAVIHPYAKIDSAQGPVTVGPGAIVWEKAVVGVAEGGLGAVELGKNVVVGTGAVVEGNAGEGTVIEACAKIGAGASVGKFCKIGSYVNIAPGTEVPDFTIVFGQNLSRLDTTAQSDPLVREVREAAHAKLIAGLRLLIPSNLAKWT